MEIPYKISYFLIFSIVPFMGALLLLFIRFLFFEDKDYIRGYNTNKKITNSNNNSNNRNNNNNNNSNDNGGILFKIQLTLFILSMIGFVFTLSSFSSWNYLPIELTIILSIILLVFFTLYQLIIQFEVERKKRIFKVRSNKNKNYFITSPNNNTPIIINSPIGIEMISHSSNSNNNNNNNSDNINNKTKKEILSEPLNINNDTENNNNNQNQDQNQNYLNYNSGDEFDEYDDEEINDNDTILNKSRNQDNNYFYYKTQIDSKLSIKENIKTRVIYFIKDSISTIQYKPKLSIILIVCSILLAIFIPLLLEGVCICSHPMMMSTRFTRRFQESYCKENEICFIYLTLPEDASKSMILQIHTRNKPNKIQIELINSDILSIPSKQWESNNYISMSDIIKDEPRYISYIEFKDLIDNTNYKFNLTIDIGGNGIIQSRLYRFKTLSSDIETPVSERSKNLKFIVGGDISLNEDSKQLAKQASKFKPDFVIVGGDIAYEDGIGSCYRRWDEKLSFFTKYFTYDYNDDDDDDGSIQSLTPLLMSIGNHESGAFFQTHKQVPFYFRYFLFNLGDMNRSINSRLSYHIHKLPFNSSIVSLDSCVVSTWSDQVDWLNNQWSKNQDYIDTNKLVVYHHPIYPSWSNLNGDIPLLGQKTVVPLFDRYKVPFAFENHEHLFKRTRPLYNSQLVNDTSISNGTVYIGDGSWGISNINQKPIENDPILPWYLIKRSFCNHLWFTTINETQIKVEAFSPDGDKIDKVEFNK